MGRLSRMRRNPWRPDLALLAVTAGYFLAAIAASLSVLAGKDELFQWSTKAFVAIPFLAFAWVAPAVVWDFRDRRLGAK